MTPRLWMLSAFLTIVFAAFLLACRYWPDETKFRQVAADIAGLIGGLLALLCWVLASLASSVLARTTHRGVTR